MIIFDLYNEIVSEEEKQPPTKEEEEKLKKQLLLQIPEERESLQVVNIYGEIVSI